MAYQVEWNPTAARSRGLTGEMPDAAVTESGNVAVKARAGSRLLPRPGRAAGQAAGLSHAVRPGTRVVNRSVPLVGYVCRRSSR